MIGLLAYALPVNTKSDVLTAEYRSSATKVQQTLEKWYKDWTQLYRSRPLQIIHQLLGHTWDKDLFTSFFGFEMDHESSFLIDFGVFKKSLEYVQTQSSLSVNLFHHFFAHKPFELVRFINELKQGVQENVFDENKLLALFRLCIVIDDLSPFLTNQQKPATNGDANSEFLLGDILHFFGNSIASKNTSAKLKLAICRYLLRFCRQVLPACSRFVAKHLYFVVSTLVPIVKLNRSDELEQTALQLLHFLLIEQGEKMRDAISLLDHFPAQPQFNDLRKLHSEIKYSDGKEFSLVEEVEFFLKIENRSIEGLIALKHQVIMSTQKDIVPIANFMRSSLAVIADKDRVEWIIR